MHDLANLPISNQKQYPLGGGNPAPIPEIQDVFVQLLHSYAENQQELTENAFNYPSAQGHSRFIKSLAALLNQHYGWGLTEKNILLTNGSQSAFFMLFNLLAGEFKTGLKKILLPMAPEYIGYEDTGLAPSMFSSIKPRIEQFSDNTFKYRLDTDALQIHDDVAAICVSRPTNPTGNVITDEELDALDNLAQLHGIPLIIDNAYGAPFPNIIHVPSTLRWHSNIVLSMSLSKLGFPGLRTGIIVARDDIIDALTQINAVMSLSPCSLGPGILQPILENGKILSLCENVITPFYRQRAEDALRWFHEAFAGTSALVHKPEGALFLWLWLPDLTMGTAQLYKKLKKIGVIVVPGHYFFPGIDPKWPHTQQCIRVNVSGDPELIQAGFKLIANEIRTAS